MSAAVFMLGVCLLLAGVTSTWRLDSHVTNGTAAPALRGETFSRRDTRRDTSSPVTMSPGRTSVAASTPETTRTSAPASDTTNPAALSYDYIRAATPPAHTASAATPPSDTTSAATPPPNTARAATSTPDTTSAATPPDTTSAATSPPHTASAATPTPHTSSAATPPPNTSTAATPPPNTTSAARQPPDTTSAARLAPDTTSAATPPPNTTSAETLSPQTMPYTCGDGFCQCGEHMADCSNHKEGLTYIPRLPGTIQKLDISGNSLTSSYDLLTNASGIWHLSLAKNHIGDITRAMISWTKRLTTLVLNENPGLTMDSLANVLSAPYLDLLSADSCKLPPPPTDAFKDIKSNVTILSLRFNIYDEIYNLSGFCSLKRLENLKLEGCNVRQLTSSCPLEQLANLDLSHNAMEGFPVTCVGNTSMFPALRYLTLSYNHIDTISTSSVCLPSLSYLDMSHNMVKFLSTGTFSGNNFPSLRRLYLNHQTAGIDVLRLGTYMENNVFDNPGLEELKLGYNLLKFDTPGVDKDAFANCSQLRILDLERSDFSHVNEQRFTQLFGHLKSLTELVLANSELEFVSSKLFEYFPRLLALDLGDNFISSIPDGTFDSLENLDFLLLQNNKIAVVTEQTFSAALRVRIGTLALDRNPFTCTCELTWFRDWLVSEKIMFEDYLDDYRCQNIPGRKLKDFHMAEQACLLTREVNIVIILISCVIIVALTVASLLFQFRWHLRLLLYEAFRGRADVRRQRLAADHFTYDVFVSYASEDLPWVRQHLMPQLEERLGLRLCVHERDFIPGKNVVDNIVDCVDSSKKVLMVFSRHFVLSQWCQFELAFCLTHVMDYDDVLIVVCVDDVAWRVVTSAMMAVFKTTTYIQWEEGPDAEASFWGRLHIALEEILNIDEHYV